MIYILEFLHVFLKGIYKKKNASSISQTTRYVSTQVAFSHFLGVDFLKIGCRNKNGCNSVNSELQPFSAIYSDFDCN